MIKVDQFTKAYIECMFWAGIHDEDEEKFNKRGQEYTIGDIHESCLKKILDDCQRFQSENAADIQTYDDEQYTPEEMAGHDFFLTRNGHGSGFWDGDWPKESGKRLTEAARKFGTFDIFVDEDGKVYRT